MVVIVQVLGKYMIIRYLDPFGLRKSTQEARMFLCMGTVDSRMTFVLGIEGSVQWTLGLLGGYIGI